MGRRSLSVSYVSASSIGDASLSGLSCSRADVWMAWRVWFARQTFASSFGVCSRVSSILSRGCTLAWKKCRAYLHLHTTLHFAIVLHVFSPFLIARKYTTLYSLRSCFCVSFPFVSSCIHTGLLFVIVHCVFFVSVFACIHTGLLFATVLHVSCLETHRLFC